MRAMRKAGNVKPHIERKYRKKIFFLYTEETPGGIKICQACSCMTCNVSLRAIILIDNGIYLIANYNCSIKLENLGYSNLGR